MRNNLLLLFSVVVVLVLVGACQHDPFIPNTPPDNKPDPKPYTGVCDPDSVYFKNTIEPILTSNCSESGCHDVISANSGVVMISYQTIMDSDIIEPGDAEGSDLYRVINETDIDKVMPDNPDIPLTHEQIDLVKKWINQGALNNGCNGDCDSTYYTYAANVKPILDLYCVGCHNGPLPQGNKALATYTDVKKFADNGKLVGSIIHDVNFVAMPYKAEKLSDCQIAIIRKWVEDGAPNN